MDAVEGLARMVGTAPACAALTVSRASLYLLTIIEKRSFLNHRR